MKTPMVLVTVWFVTLGTAAQHPAAEREVRTSSQAYKLPPPRLVANTSIVTLDVVVRRTDGTTVDDLQQTDFRVLDNGQPRALSAFSVEHHAAAPLAVPASAPAYAPAPLAAAPVAVPALPRSVVLFFDDVNTDKNDLANARLAAARFLREGMELHDRAALRTASGNGETEFTSGGAALTAAVARIAPHPRQAATGMVGCPRITPYEAYGITTHSDPGALAAALAEKKACDIQQGLLVNDGSQTYEAGGGAMPGSDNESEQVIAQAIGTWDQARAVSQATLGALRGAVEDLAQAPGNRMLLLASGGFLGVGDVLEGEQDRILQDALHAGIVINSLDAQGLYSAAPGREIQNTPDLMELPIPTMIYEEEAQISQKQAEEFAMANLAESTGGLYFHNNNDLTVGFRRLGLMPEVVYTMAFSNGDVARDGKFHKLKVELAEHSKLPAQVQARPGYFAPSATAAAAELPNAMDDAMRAGTAADGIAAEVAPSPAAHGEAVDIHLDTAKLSLPDVQGRHRQDLYFIAGLFSADGRFLTGKRAEMDLALTDATWKKFVVQGFSAKLTLDAPRGAYSLRVVIGESSDGKISAVSQPVRIP